MSAGMYVGWLIGSVLSGVLTTFLSRKVIKQRAHVHRWKNVAIKPVEMSSQLFFGWTGDSTTTKQNGVAVLERCSCGATRSISLAGNWTLAELSGVSSSEAVDALLRGDK